MNWDSPDNVMTTLRDAQDWDGVLSSGGPAERAAFASWVRESQSNLAVYLKETALSVELSSLDSQRQFDLDALISAVTQQPPVDDSKR
jgi:ferric-dicitrate binding protein FerR (iron transport regulator)